MVGHAVPLGTEGRRPLSTAADRAGSPFAPDSSAVAGGPAGAVTFEWLYRKYADALRAFCRGRLGNNDAEAEDACHEAILKAHLAMKRSRPKKIWPWLATIAANVCIDIQRKRSRIVGLDSRFERPSGDDGTEREAAARIRAEILRKALKRLPFHYRTYLYLVDYEGYSYDEISKRHSVSVGSVGSTLLRAREALKTQVKRTAQSMGQWPLP